MARSERVDGARHRLVERHRMRGRRHVGRAIAGRPRAAEVLGGPDPAHAVARRQRQVAHRARAERLYRQIERLQLGHRSVVHRHQRRFRPRSRQHGAIRAQRGERGPHRGAREPAPQRPSEAVAEAIDRRDQVEVRRGRDSARHPLGPAFDETEGRRGIDAVVEIGPHRGVPQSLRDEPVPRRGDAPSGQRRMGAQPVHPARRCAEHQLILARQPPQRQPEESERQAVQPVGGTPGPADGRSGAEVQIETGDLVRRRLPDDPGREERFAQLVRDRGAPALSQVELGELLRNGRSAFGNAAQVADHGTQEARRAERWQPRGSVEESAILVSGSGRRDEQGGAQVRIGGAVLRELLAEERRRLLHAHAARQRERRDQPRSGGRRHRAPCGRGCAAPVPPETSRRAARPAAAGRGGTKNGRCRGAPDHRVSPMRRSTCSVSAGV